MGECVYKPEDEKKIDYKSEEFRIKNKIDENYFKYNINLYKEHFNIDTEQIKNGDEDTNYNIPFLAEPIMALMFKNFKSNPFIDGRVNKNNISIDKIINYNKKVFKDIEKLPVDMKYNIMNTSTYEFNYILNEVAPAILDRMCILFSLIISESSVSAGNSYIELIDSLDSWIMNFINHSNILENKQNEISDDTLKINIDNYGRVNFERDNTYLIDKVLKDEYIKNIDKVSLLKDKMKTVGTENLSNYIGVDLNNKTIDKSKIDRDKIIKWIYNAENMEIFNYEELIKERELYLNQVKDELNRNKISTYEAELEDIKNERIKKIKEIIYEDIEILYKNYPNYVDLASKVDSIISSDNYDTHTILLYNKIKDLIELEEYKIIISNKNDISHEIRNKLEIEINRLSKDLWEEVYKKDYENKKKIYRILNDKYKELNEKNSQLNLIRTYLSKAMGQTITPILQKEIKELSKGAYGE